MNDIKCDVHEAITDNATRYGVRGNLWVASALAAISALLLMACMPPLHLSCLAWVALVPFLISVRSRGVWRGAFLGLAFGWIYQSIIMYWLSRFGGFAPIAGGLIKAVVPAILGAILGGLRPKNSWVYVSAVTASWLTMEYLQSSGSLGFTLGLLCNTQVRQPVWLQVNSLFGPWTLSLVIAAVNAALADWAWHTLWERETLNWRPWTGHHPCRGTLLAAASLVVATLIFGIWRMSTFTITNDKPITLGAIQLAARQEDKFAPGKSSKFMRKLHEMSREAVQKGAEIVLWPETSIPYTDFTRHSRELRRFKRAVRQTGVSHLVGYVAYDTDKVHKLNRISAFDARGRLLDSYDKIHLVPFGEFLPLEKMWPNWKILDQIMRFNEGRNKNCLNVDGCQFGTLICFESMVTTVPREHVLKGAEVLIVPTNDGWFGKSALLPMHFEISAMRAVETGRYVVQVANTGISGFINPLGQIMQQSEIDENAILVDKVYRLNGQTLYMQLGDLLPCFALIWLCILVSDHFRQPRRFTL